MGSGSDGDEGERQDGQHLPQGETIPSIAGTGKNPPRTGGLELCHIRGTDEKHIPCVAVLRV